MKNLMDYSKFPQSNQNSLNQIRIELAVCSPSICFIFAICTLYFAFFIFYFASCVLHFVFCILHSAFQLKTWSAILPSNGFDVRGRGTPRSQNSATCKDDNAKQMMCKMDDNAKHMMCKMDIVQGKMGKE